MSKEVKTVHSLDACCGIILILNNLPIVFTMIWFIFKPIMCQIYFKILCTNFQGLKWNLHTGSFFQEGVQKPKSSSFTVINSKEKQQILTFKKLEPANVSHCCLLKWLKRSKEFSIKFRFSSEPSDQNISDKIQTAQKREVSLTNHMFKSRITSLWSTSCVYALIPVILRGWKWRGTH